MYNIAPLKWNDKFKKMLQAEIRFNQKVIFAYEYRISWVNKVKGVVAEMPTSRERFAFKSIDLAKAACQAHWENLIRESGWIEND